MLLAVLLMVACAPVAPTEQPLSLDFRSTNLTVGMPASEAIAALGDDFTLSESESCAGEGMDQMYTYPSLRLYVFAPEGGEAIVTSVCYTDDGAAIKGITIGCAADAAVAALGEPDEHTEGKLVYRDEMSVLTLSLRDGIVTAIVLSEK
jgi:hypothetical protein